MLACRLCVHFGIDDPEQWLEDCHPRKWNLWRAYFNLEPETFGFTKIERPPPIEDQVYDLVDQWGLR